MNNISRLVVTIVAFVAVAIAVAACSPLAVVDALTPSDTYVATEHIAYGIDPRHTLDVYAPPARDAGAGYPVVLFIHGGTWVSGDRRDYRFIGEALASRGIVTVVANYRLYPQVRYPDFLADSARAAAWVKREISRYGGDTARFFVMGHSSGAYNAAMLALDQRWLAAEGLAPSVFAGWIGLAGPYEFLPMTNVDAQPLFFHPHYPPGTQPVDYVTRAAPPAFLGAAQTDDVVNPERNTRQLADKLRVAGAPVTLRIYPKANHYTMIGVFARPLRSLEPVLDDVVAFVRGDRAAR